MTPPAPGMELAVVERGYAPAWRFRAGLRGAGAIVGDVVARLPGHARVIARERIVTDEGEYAARAVVEAGGEAVAVGVLFGDDGHFVAVAAAGALSSSAVRGTRLGLPAVRRRRFLYAVPAGWQPTAGAGLGTVWHRGDALIVVYPAQPEAGGLDAGAMAAVVGGRTTFPAIHRGAACFGNAARLRGTVVDLDSEAGYLAQVAVLGDGRFLYPLRLESSATSYRDNWHDFVRVVDSIEPLPMRACGHDVVDHWVS